MALAKNLGTSGRSLLKLSTPSLSAVAPRSICVCKKSAQNNNNIIDSRKELLSQRASGIRSQTRAMTTTQRRLAAVEGTFRIEKDTFGELKVNVTIFLSHAETFSIR